MKTFFSNANITSMTSGLFSMLLVWMLFHAGIEGAQADTAGGNLPSPGTIALLQPEDEECIALGKLLQQSNCLLYTSIPVSQIIRQNDDHVRADCLTNFRRGHGTKKPCQDQHRV